MDSQIQQEEGRSETWVLLLTSSKRKSEETVVMLKKKKKSFKRQAEMVSEERHVTFNFLQNDRGSGESGGTMRQNWQ